MKQTKHRTIDNNAAEEHTTFRVRGTIPWKHVSTEESGRIREELDRTEELLHADRKDELERLRKARCDEKVIEYMKHELKKGGAE